MNRKKCASRKILILIGGSGGFLCMEYSILYSIFRSKIKRILINKIEFIFDLEFRSVGKLFQTSKSGPARRR